MEDIKLSWIRQDAERSALDKSLTRILLLTFVIVVGVLLVEVVRADDVYNFYFQKAPGPSSVTQGGTASPVLSNGPLPPNAAVTVDPAGQTLAKFEQAKVLPPEYYPWELNLGIGYLYPGSYAATSDVKGWTIGVKYNLSKFFALNFNLIKLDVSYISVPNNLEGELDKIDFAFGFVFTPFRLQLFNHQLLDIGIAGGYMSVPMLYPGYYDSEGDLQPAQFMMARIMLPYYGPHLTIHFVDHIALVWQERFMRDSYSSSNLSVAYQF